MSKQIVDRRKALKVLGFGAVAPLASKAGDSILVKKNRPYTYCLNMATIRGHKLGFVKELETCAAAGFRSVEIWMDSLQQYLAGGGTVNQAKKLLDDLGLQIEDCISFDEWIVDDASRRAKGIEQMKKGMVMLETLGCKRMAATGKGAEGDEVPPMDVIAERYHAILEMGRSFGVVPQLEMWGFQKNLSDIAEVTYIAMKSRQPDTRVLLDIFHLYRGHTSLDSLKLMNPNAAEILHMNDYPANFPYQTITDADRIYPGDGVAPLRQTLNILLKDRDKPLVLSTELFNANYYKQDALTVAKTSLSKMKAVVASL